MLPHELGHLLPLGEDGPDDELAEGVLEGVTPQTAAASVIAVGGDAFVVAAAAAAAAVIVAGSRAVVPSPGRQRQGWQLRRKEGEHYQSQSLSEESGKVGKKQRAELELVCH